MKINEVSITITYDLDKSTLVGVKTDPPDLLAETCLGILDRTKIDIDTWIRAKNLKESMSGITIANGPLPKGA